MDQSCIVHSRFLRKLPYDIICNIFLYLDRQDCLNCMATCREWYDKVSQYTEDKWKTLQLGQDGITQRQERNLGKHVKHILFTRLPEDSLSNMMQNY